MVFGILEILYTTHKVLDIIGNMIWQNDTMTLRENGAMVSLNKTQVILKSARVSLNIRLNGG